MIFARTVPDDQQDRLFRPGLLDEAGQRFAIQPRLRIIGVGRREAPAPHKIWARSAPVGAERNSRRNLAGGNCPQRYYRK